MTAATVSRILTNTYVKRVPNFAAKDRGLPRYKVGYVTLPATADNGDTVTIDVYKEFGISRVLAVIGWIHTTADSVMVKEAPTTTVDITNLTITVGGATPNKQRFYAVYGV